MVLTVLDMKITVFSDMVPCRLIERYQCFRGTCLLDLQGRPWRCKQWLPLTHQYLSIRLHRIITSQKRVILIIHIICKEIFTVNSWSFTERSVWKGVSNIPLFILQWEDQYHVWFLQITQKNTKTFWLWHQGETLI